MEDTTDADYTYTKRVCKDFEIKNLEEYPDLYVQSNMSALVDLLENIRNMCLKHTNLILQTLEICILKYRNLILGNLFQLQDYHEKRL